MTSNTINPLKSGSVVLAVIVGLAWMPVETARAQIGPVPGTDFPFFFDDFHYPVSVPTSFDPGSTAYPPNHVLGPSDWFVAGGPGQPMTMTNSRGWFNYSWMEFGGQGRAWNYVAGEPCDSTWFDPCGFFLTTDDAITGGSYSKLSELDTGARAYDPSLLLFRAEPGTYNPNASIRLSSGVAARTGTWVARVLLPDFDGLRHHGRIGAAPVDPNIDMYPAFWLQSSEFHVDNRPGVFPDGSDSAWSEANYELNNWFDPDAGNGHKAISAGITWANQYMSNRTDNPRMGTSGTPGKCYIVDDSGAGRWGSTDPRECFDILTGKQHGPLFVTLYLVISETNVTYYILAWDEDLYHTRGNFYPGFDFLFMTTVDTFRHFAPPRLLRTLFDLNLKTATGTGELQERKDMLMDWIFYTPRILGTTTSPNIYNIPGQVRKIRDHLWSQYNSSRPEAQHIWRVNTTGLPIDRAVDTTTDNPCFPAWPGNRRAAAFDFDIDLTPYSYGSRLFFSPDTRVDVAGSPALFTRHTTYNVEWEIYEVESGGGRQLVDQQSERGFVYELPGNLRTGTNPVDIEVTVQELANTGGICGTYTDSYRFFPSCAPPGSFCTSAAHCCSGYCNGFFCGS